ncbi:hypothetical protein [Micromonospora sp. WMMD812]|uniref:hypothetical protein n=1 Tax=Micromonospora sp. WMMD812 TaxID=3015152 RepID=UPI00248CB14A|nr:hypothetical protein [Micromonospora sp. WMMD812]WBB67608.1 hypothetical protein O7603_31775 [Micromonospora sp. WMMD812]
MVLPAAARELNAFATRVDTTRMAVALAWLLQRSPNILHLPGASSVTHKREDFSAGALALPQRR